MDTTDVLRCIRLLPVIVIEGAARASDLAHTLGRAAWRHSRSRCARQRRSMPIRTVKDAAPNFLGGAGRNFVPEHFKESYCSGRTVPGRSWRHAQASRGSAPTPGRQHA